MLDKELPSSTETDIINILFFPEGCVIFLINEIRLDFTGKRFSVLLTGWRYVSPTTLDRIDLSKCHFCATARCNLFFTLLFPLISWVPFARNIKLQVRVIFPVTVWGPNIPQTHKRLNYNWNKCTIKYSFQSKLQTEHPPQISYFWCEKILLTKCHTVWPILIFYGPNTG